MNSRTYSFILVGLFAAGGLLFISQQRSIADLRAGFDRKREIIPASSNSSAGPSQENERQSPSPEILKLRNEVTMLMKELDAPVPVPAASKAEMEHDWALVHSGPKPSQLPGFVYVTNTVPAGFATPEAAFQTWQYAMRNQHKEPLKSQPPMDIWDVPDDFYDPNARYSIDIGEGIGGEVGYRIVSQEMTATDQVRLSIDFEKKDGSSFRRERVLIHRNGKWRVKPVAVRRQE